MSAPAPQLWAHHLEVAYGHRLVLKEINLHVNAGDLIGLEGPNGSGKTTLLKTLSGLIKPRGGKLEWAEENAEASLFTPGCSLYEDLTVGENLSFFQKIYGSSPEHTTRLSRDLLLEDLLESPVRHLSLGQKIRTALARTLLKPARLYFFDEPFGALDKQSQQHLLGVLTRLAGEGAGLIIATHLMDTLSSLFNRRLRLNEGRLTEENCS